VNHVGLEGSSFPSTGPVRYTDYPVASVPLLDWYVTTMGMRLVRIVFSWEAVQNNTMPMQLPLANIPGTGGYKDYWDDLVGPTGIVNRLIDRDVYVVLGMYQHNPQSGDTDIVYKGESFTAEHFAAFWGEFATAVNNAVTALPPGAARKKQVGFDLINEPHEQNAFVPNDKGITLAKWKDCAQKAIDKIRATPGNTNTIFVPGMGYASASGFVTNGSDAMWATLTDPLNNIAVTAHCYDGTHKLPGQAPSNKPTDVLRKACEPLIGWARTKGVKVHIGEIAIDAGLNGCSNEPLAKSQWADWKKFCLENNDVLIGWNWWANTQTPGWDWSEGGSCTDERQWRLARGSKEDPNVYEPSVYANLIKGSLPVPAFQIRDNFADPGTEPNTTTTLGYESPDIWVRPTADGIEGDAPIQGGLPCVVYVRVTNKGQAPYPADGNDVVALYWAQASAGLSWPAPWNGSVPKQGGMITATPIGALAANQSKLIPITWLVTPNPIDYPNSDGHFCLIAVITKQASQATLAKFEFEGFEGPNLNQSVLKLNNVGWHNIHILPTAKMRVTPRLKLGDVVVANHTDREMRAQLGFEVLDAAARPLNRDRVQLLIDPEPAALEKLRAQRADRAALEELGHGTFRVLDPAEGIPQLDLRPGESLQFGLTCAMSGNPAGYAVRAIQYARDGAAR
jgi:aryl-phospho-beta-D-glucosidase BglC (GH1 family)